MTSHSEQLAPDQFAIGDLVVTVKARGVFWEHHKRYQIGMRGTIVTGPELSPGYSDHWAKAYVVELENGERDYFVAECLRKLQPPCKDREVVRWADCPWQPESLHV